MPEVRIAQPPADSACSLSWLKETRYFDPLAAEMRSAQVAALALAKGTPVKFLQDTSKKRRQYWDIDLGAELPIASYNCGGEYQGRVSKGAWGLGYWISVDFHMLEDMIDPSNPILNTDYRFAFSNLKFQYGLDTNVALGFRLQLGHESTHLGDEYSLAARRNHAEFQRINVSYEWIDFATSLEFGGHTHFRAGGIVPLKLKGTSYFQTDTLEAPGSVVQPSSNWFEPYFGAQYSYEFEKLEVYGSVDARWKTIYDYERTAASSGEDRAWSLNAVVGISRLRLPQSGIGRASPYIRAYYGVNPHGQFRNQRHFFIGGLGLRLHR